MCFIVPSLTKAQYASVDSAVTFHRILEETAVVATKLSDDVKSAIPQFSLGKEAMLTRGVTDIADAVHRLPGATLRDYGGAGGLKTVSVRGLGATHTTLSYDGIALSDMQTGAVDISRYSTDNIDNLTLIIGDNDNPAIPVRQAVAPAALSIDTPRLPDDKDYSLAVRLKAGSWQAFSPFVNFNRRLSSTLTLGLTGEYIHALNNYPFKWKNGNVVTTERRENNRLNSGHAEADLLWKNGSGHSLDSKVYFYKSNHQLPGPVLYYNVNHSNEVLRCTNAFAQTKYKFHIDGQWQFNAATKFNYTSTLYDDFGNDMMLLKQERYYQREYYVTANILFRPARHWTLDYAADYFFNNLNSSLATESNPYRHSILQALSVKYHVGRLTVNGRLIESIYLTGERGQAGRQCYNRLSPSVSLSFNILKTRRLYTRISYKNIFRMPTFNEAFFGQFRNPALKPESTDQFDIGLSYQLDKTGFIDGLTVTADYYHNRVKNRIVSIPYNLFVWMSTNLNHVNVNGADVTLNAVVSLKRSNSLVLGGSWSYQRAKIDVEHSSAFYGKQVAYIPLNSGSFSVSWENPWINLVWHGQGCSARYTANSNIPETRLPGYFEFGATAWRCFDIKQVSLELRFDLLNIFDKQYFVIARYPMPGRSWQASIRFNI